MKKLIVLFTLVVLLPFTAIAKDMQEYLNVTEEFVRQGKYKEALERHLWFHDNALKHERAMYGVRLSFALANWKELGDAYSPALDALKKVRNDKTKQLKEGKGNFNLFHDVQSLNRILDESIKTVELFHELDKNQKKLASRCWETAKKDIYDAKDYVLVRKYLGNFMREYSKIKSSYESTIKMNKKHKMGAMMKSWNEENFVKETVQLIEIAIAMDDSKSAKEIQKKALDVFEDFRLKDSLNELKKKEAGAKGSPKSN